MSDEKETQTYINAFGYVKRSKNRQKIIRIIATSRKTPSDITEIMDARFSLVSSILSDLKNNGIVVCLNENDKTGRLYVLTDLGLEILSELDQQ